MLLRFIFCWRGWEPHPLHGKAALLNAFRYAFQVALALAKKIVFKIEKMFLSLVIKRRLQNNVQIIPRPPVTEIKIAKERWGVYDWVFPMTPKAVDWYF